MRHRRRPITMVTQRMLLRRLRLAAAAVIAVCLLDSRSTVAADSRSAIVRGRPPVPPSRSSRHPEVLYGVDEESAVGTKVGRSGQLVR